MSERSMKRVSRQFLACMTVVLIGLAAVPAVATPTNGYFSHGYGVRSQGMAGIGIALPQDALAAATNPAGMALVGNRIDLGASLARRTARSALGPNFGPFAGEYNGNDTQNFLIPEFGYNRMIRNDMSLGVSVYANGGMNTDYADLNARTAGILVPGSGIFGTGTAGLDLIQLFIAPTLAAKASERQAFGISPIFAYQQFQAEGAQNFDNPLLSSSPGNVTNRGSDHSTGWGIRLGWVGEIAPNVTVGATWQSRLRMDKFDRYRGLLAEQGGFDIPANYGLGIAVRANPRTTVAADIQTIEFGRIASLGNSGNAPTLLGADNGPGFGWRNMTILKIGISHAFRDTLTLRAGVSHGTQPVPGDQTAFNMLAPVTVQDHLTLGATWTLRGSGELSLAYVHGFRKTVNGSGATAGRNISLEGDILGIAYGWRY